MFEANTLNRKASSLLKGAATVVSVNPCMSRRVEVILNRSNTQALARDWNAVGGDIRAAMNGFDTTQKG